MYIKKGYVERLIKMVDEIPLKKKASRMRSKFKNILIDKFKNEIFNDIKTIESEYVTLDEQGNPNLYPNGSIIYTDVDAYVQDINELFEEEIYLDEKEYREVLLSMKFSILEWDKEFSGSDADFYDLICELFEGLDIEE